MAVMQAVFVVVAVCLLIADAQLATGPLDDPSANGTAAAGKGGDDPSLSKSEIETESRRQDGDRYTWQHDIGSGDTFSERAYVLNGANVITVKSRDPSLETVNVTRATSVYYFTDYAAVVAIIPWRISGPCIVRNSTLNYKQAIDLLTARNGSTVLSTSKVAIDANVAPLSSEEAVLFLERNQGLQRACGRRQIVLTTESGDNPRPYSNATEQIVTLTLEADVSIKVPERPEVPDNLKTGSRRFWGKGNRWGNKFELGDSKPKPQA